MKNPKRQPPAPILDTLSALIDQENHSEPTRPSAPGVEGVQLDYELAVQFLLSYDGSKQTFNAYRRDLERLLQWSWRIRRASVRALTRDDIVEHIKFSQNPPLAWIGHKNVPRFLIKSGTRSPNPDWRPYVAKIPKAQVRAGDAPDLKEYRPSQASLRANFKVLSSFYDWLAQEGHVEANPVTLIRQKSKFLRREHNEAQVRRLSDLQWDYVIETAEMMAERDPEAHERTLFIMTALFTMYLRISELVADERSAPMMSDFRKDRDGNWWFHVTGKGNKRRTVTVSDSMLEALKRFRQALGLKALPSVNDKTPLIPKIRGKGPVTNTRGIRKIIQSCFDEASARMRQDGLDETDWAELEVATAHWLRHTGISEDVQMRPREHVRDDAGHASMATTDRYIESNQRERHASGRHKPTRLLENP